MSEALRGSAGARRRLLALAAVLDAGVVVDGGDLRRLNRLLGQITHGAACLVEVPAELMTAVGYACAFWDNPHAGRWLGWALSARLDQCLVQTWLPGPGLSSMMWHKRLAERGFGRETHWICELPQQFWTQLEHHGWDDLNQGGRSD